MRPFAAAILLACAGSAAAADCPSFEYGHAAEIKGVHKVFINVGPEITMRNELAEQLERELPGVKVTDHASDAEAVIAIVPDTDPDITHFIVYRPLTAGTGRLLFELKATPSHVHSYKPHMRFARMFVEEYRKANAAP
ncbi:MAG TPA: hypothetical protein VHY33_16155 [Thermoanaerobaculia bacterium]|jgi:hypothetical protein|nr:hypothetical protein [Thermoanaerobaculia bacterium]